MCRRSRYACAKLDRPQGRGNPREGGSDAWFHGGRRVGRGGRLCGAARACSCCSSRARSLATNSIACVKPVTSAWSRSSARDRPNAVRRHPHRQSAGARAGAERQDAGDQGAGGRPVEGRPDHGARGVGPLSPASPSAPPRSTSRSARRTRRCCCIPNFRSAIRAHHRRQHRQRALLGLARGHRAADSRGGAHARSSRAGSSWRTCCCATCSCPRR